MKRTVKEVAYHRNGIVGNGFNVALIRDSDGSTKVAVRFDDHQGGLNIAVLDVALLAEGIIAFGENSWRGDEYAPLVDTAIRAYELARTP